MPKHKKGEVTGLVVRNNDSRLPKFVNYLEEKMIFDIEEIEIMKEALSFHKFNCHYNKELEKKIDLILDKLNLEEFYGENN